MEGAGYYAFWFALAGVPLLVMRQRECNAKEAVNDDPRSLDSPRPAPTEGERDQWERGQHGSDDARVEGHVDSAKKAR